MNAIRQIIPILLAGPLTVALLLSAGRASAYDIYTWHTKYSVIGNAIVRMTPETTYVRVESFYDGYLQDDPISLPIHTLLGATSCDCGPCFENTNHVMDWGFSLHDESHTDCICATLNGSAYVVLSENQPSANCDYLEANYTVSQTYIHDLCQEPSDDDHAHWTETASFVVGDVCDQTTIWYRARLSLEVDGHGDSEDNACVRFWNSDDECVFPPE